MPPPPLRPSAGFTLFEVALSLGLVSIGIISVLMLMPTGLKAQQLSRYQLLAAAKAIDVMSVNVNQWRKWDKQRLEASRFAANSINGVAHAPLAEQKASNWRHGCLPLPPEIARRLDSENDEIARILAEGGTLFYANPRAVSSIDEEELALDDRRLPNEAGRLVFAITGYAQQYALANHPLKAWPYYDWYPVVPRGRPGTKPPMSSRHEDAWQLSQGGPVDQRWPGLMEFRALVEQWQTFPDAAVTDAAQVLAYRDLAKALVMAVGVTVDPVTGVPAPPPGSALDPVKPYQVLAVAYLAQANAWLTSPGFMPAPTAADRDAWRVAAKDTHEACLQWVRRYASTDPYDWGADRPLNFQNAWDHPLLQVQLFAGNRPGDGAATLFTNTNVPTDVAWPILSARPVTNAGCGSSFPFGNPQHTANVANLKAGFGDPSTFNLADRFEAAERCRQLVFWVADWQSYEDFESTPSAPLDASKFHYDSEGHEAYNNSAHKFGNPEVMLLFRDADRLRTADRGIAESNRPVFLGLFGADRNGNGVFDRGATPAAVRLRATEVGRFNFYNPRVWCGLKN
jgi:hypothetical protein